MATTSQQAMVEVLPLPLTGIFARPEAEMSGLAWWRDELVLCPQYPARFSPVRPGVAAWVGKTKGPATGGPAVAPAASGSAAASGPAAGKAAKGGPGALAANPRAALLAHLEGRGSAPIEPRAIAFDDAGLAANLTGFDGYEAIVFAGDRAFLTIEKRQLVGAAGGLGHLVSGTISADGNLLRIDPDSRQDLPVPVVAPNMGFEALSIVNGSLLAFFETNGSGLVRAPVVQRFGLSPAGGLTRRDPLPLSLVDYRITAASAPDAQGRLWALNIYWKGEPFLCRTGADEAEKAVGIEQLIELQVTDQGVVRTPRPPIVLRPEASGKARNWEGLAWIEGRGFLVITDEYPDTRLGFVPFAG